MGSGIGRAEVPTPRQVIDDATEYPGFNREASRVLLTSVSRRFAPALAASFCEWREGFARLLDVRPPGEAELGERRESASVALAIGRWEVL